MNFPLKAHYVCIVYTETFLHSHSIGSGYVLLHHVMGGVEGKQGAWAYPEGGKENLIDLTEAS